MIYKKSVCFTLALLLTPFCLSANDEVFNHKGDITNEEKVLEEDSKDGFSAHFGSEIFSKFGFNKARIDEERGIYPTETFQSIITNLDFEYKVGNLKLGLGGAVAGIIFDDTRFARDINGEAYAPLGLTYNYIGYYAGYTGANFNDDNEAFVANRHNYMIHNAYLQYENDKFNALLGRFYHEGDDWYEGYTEGAYFSYEDRGFKVDLLGVNSMANQGYGWFYDYQRLYVPSGLINANFSYSNDHAKALVGLYVSPLEYSSLNLHVDFSLAKGSWQFNTTLIGLMNYYLDGVNKSIVTPYFGEVRGFNGSFFAKQDFVFKENLNLGVGIYKNFGNSNARIGTFGSPIGFDIWNSSVYLYGASLSDAVGSDAFNALFTSSYSFSNIASSLEGIDVGLNGRYTTSPRSDEYFLELALSFILNEYIQIHFAGTYYTDITKKGFDITYSDILLESNNISDRSYLSTRISLSY